MTYEDYLIHSSECYHALFGSRWRNRRHGSNFRPKYIAKEGDRYFYSQQDYDAFKRGRYRSSSRSSRIQSVQRKENKRVSSKVKSDSTIDRLKNSFNKTISDIKKFASDVINRGKRFIQRAFYKTLDKMYPNSRVERTKKKIESEYLTNLKKSGRASDTIRKSEGRDDREVAIATSARREAEKKMDRLENEYRRYGDNITLNRISNINPINMRIDAKMNLKEHTRLLNKYQSEYDAEMKANSSPFGKTVENETTKFLAERIRTMKALIKSDKEFIEDIDKDISRKIERGEY